MDIFNNLLLTVTGMSSCLSVSCPFEQMHEPMLFLFYLFIFIYLFRCQLKPHHRLLLQPGGYGQLVWSPKGTHRDQWGHCDYTRHLQQS